MTAAPTIFRLSITMGRNDIVEGVGAVWADVENALANGIEQVGGAGFEAGDWPYRSVGSAR